MNHYISHKKLSFSFALVAILGFSNVIMAQSPSNQVTDDQRQKMIESHKKMAEMHSKMVACLDSDKTLSQCHQEMVDACTNNFDSNCPFMGKGKMGRARGMGMMPKGSCFDWIMAPNAAEPANSTPKK